MGRIYTSLSKQVGYSYFGYFDEKYDFLKSIITNRLRSFSIVFKTSKTKTVNLKTSIYQD